MGRPTQFSRACRANNLDHREHNRDASAARKPYRNRFVHYRSATKPRSASRQRRPRLRNRQPWTDTVAGHAARAPRQLPLSPASDLSPRIRPALIAYREVSHPADFAAGAPPELVSRGPVPPWGEVCCCDWGICGSEACCCGWAGALSTRFDEPVVWLLAGWDSVAEGLRWAWRTYTIRTSAIADAISMAPMKGCPWTDLVGAGARSGESDLP